MKIKPGANIEGIDIRMRPALIYADKLWRELGRPEGVTVTCGMDGEHSAGSLHYYGLALDFRTHYFGTVEKMKAANALEHSLGSDYDVIVHGSHIHVEFDPDLGASLNED